jgi:hypothetical protein
MKSARGRLMKGAAGSTGGAGGGAAGKAHRMGAGLELLSR